MPAQTRKLPDGPQVRRSGGSPRCALVVAVGAHRFTGVDLSDVDRLLAGEPTVTFQFNLGDNFIGKHQFNPGHPARWTMPAGLSGLLWLDNQPPFDATIRSNLDEVRLMRRRA